MAAGRQHAGGNRHSLHPRALPIIATHYFGCLSRSSAFSGSSPSAEAVARYFFEEVRKGMGGDGEKLCRVRVWEAPGCSATYSE